MLFITNMGINHVGLRYWGINYISINRAVQVLSNSCNFNWDEWNQEMVNLELVKILKIYFWAKSVKTIERSHKLLKHNQLVSIRIANSHPATLFRLVCFFNGVFVTIGLSFNEDDSFFSFFFFCKLLASFPWLVRSSNICGNTFYSYYSMPLENCVIDVDHHVLWLFWSQNISFDFLFFNLYTKPYLSEFYTFLENSHHCTGTHKHTFTKVSHTSLHLCFAGKKVQVINFL